MIRGCHHLGREIVITVQFGNINSNLPSQRISFGMSDFAEILTNLQFVTAASQIVSLK